MLLSPPQVNRFWRDWSAIIRTRGWDKTQAETERRALLQRAGFSSLTEVDKVGGFTALLKEMAALKENLSGMLRADANPRRVLIWNIEHKSPAGYWQSIAQDRFGTTDMDALQDHQLQQLLYTICDRLVQEHKPATQARRKTTNHQRQAAAPEPRLKFPDLKPSDQAAPAPRQLVAAGDLENQPF